MNEHSAFVTMRTLTLEDLARIGVSKNVIDEISPEMLGTISQSIQDHLNLDVIPTEIRWHIDHFWDEE